MDYLSPLDPDGGGTWIFVNRAGLIGCLLNNYQAPHKAENPISRGLLLVSLAGCPTLHAAAEAVEQVDTVRYSGFHLFLYDGESVQLYNWDGKSLFKTPEAQITCPLTSSGYQPKEVAAYRREQYRLQVEPEDGNHLARIKHFHNFHDERVPAHSPLMVRSDARTVSQSRVVVEPHQIDFSYRAVERNRKFQPAILATLNRDS